MTRLCACRCCTGCRRYRPELVTLSRSSGASEDDSLSECCRLLVPGQQTFYSQVRTVVPYNKG